MTAISLKQIRKLYGTVPVIHGVNIDVASGEFLVLVGPSGCGKSTLLRMIAGLEEISAGELRIGDKVVNALPPSDRDIAMVFQDYALYPHMSVEENMAFGLKMRGETTNEIDTRVTGAADILKLQDYLERRPAQLSGGQRQRVAMGRAIVRRPKAFLFDEPLSNLDAALRVEMRLEIAKLHRRMQATTVYVTHDQVEAMTLADRIVVMNAGNVEQIGHPLDLYRKPASLFVARFIGSPTMNTLQVNVVESTPNNFVLQLPAGKVAMRTGDGPAVAAKTVTFGIRPEDLTVCDATERWFSGELAVVERLGSQTFGYLDAGTEKLVTIEFPRSAEIRVGERLSVKGDIANAHLFDTDSGQRIN
ncbi:ABC transporter ATP-binding protein [Phyllobacterium bourgognense]|uniref:Carbohydrate ABC transporter ATP-binding protein (CUT1 family) n=1 Tax=Phyllobacterium bourgognense TaxID=314236 RepID=A0A368Z173_9HYPH|nr:sn-glycerol-3-phosphate ABC transporter ATP-binding protein UgpC [Phyllobacterium bourgognense]RCW85538.1 carbohydrate ABC transporter ATP-binding protein (CUT1 family) [Phyllobacterium bourgognense]